MMCAAHATDLNAARRIHYFPGGFIAPLPVEQTIERINFMERIGDAR